jgi:hypothetical protein
VALTVGPNYNLPVMAEPRAKVAWEALQQAERHAPKATPVEQALIAALGKRYPRPQPLDPSNSGPVLTAHAEALRDVAKRFPEDLDVQVLFAEAMMDINAWKLTSTVSPRPAHRDRGNARGGAEEGPCIPARTITTCTRWKSLRPGAGARLRRASDRHDACRRTPAAHAGPHHAARRPL